MELLGQVGNRELYIPLITKSMLGNEHGMVRWIKQPDGTWKQDFSLAERYIDLAIKHKWNVSVVGVHLSDGPVGGHFSYGGVPAESAVGDGAGSGDGSASEMAAPKWGTPEARQFWKPAIEGMHGAVGEAWAQEDDDVQLHHPELLPDRDHWRPEGHRAGGQVG